MLTFRNLFFFRFLKIILFFASKHERRELRIRNESNSANNDTQKVDEIFFISPLLLFLCSRGECIEEENFCFAAPRELCLISA